MEQTAIDWIVDQMLKNGYFDANKPLTFTNLDHLQHQAKQKEKEQITQAYSNGWHDGQDAIIDKIKHIDKGGDEAGSNYYSETYK